MYSFDKPSQVVSRDGSTLNDVVNGYVDSPECGESTTVLLEEFLVRLDRAEKTMRDPEVIKIVHRYNNAFADFSDSYEFAMANVPRSSHQDVQHYRRDATQKFNPIHKIDRDFKVLCRFSVLC
jgi:hypothetical protein